MNHFPILFFDLDGTIVDSGEGIMRCASHALHHYGIEEDWQQLAKFVGPPLEDSFIEFYAFPKEKTKEAVTVFRERYFRKGIYEQKLYTGVLEFLKKVKDSGHLTAITTSKMEIQAERVVNDIFPMLAPYFDKIYARDMEGVRHTKADVIRHAISDLGITDTSEILMIGDRKYDIIGARECGLKSCGVIFGYGGREELRDAGADYLASSYDELLEIV